MYQTMNGLYHKYRQAKEQQPNSFVVLDGGDYDFLLFSEEAVQVCNVLNYVASFCDTDDVKNVPYLFVDFLDLFNIIWDNPNAGEQHSNRHLVLVQ